MTEAAPRVAAPASRRRGPASTQDGQRSRDRILKAALDQVKGLRRVASKHMKPKGDAELAVAMELVLEGLHQHSMVSKWEDKSRTAYRDMLKAMFDRMAKDESE